eukprot:2066261-Heterocapsa_arctica.AAC.1
MVCHLRPSSLRLRRRSQMPQQQPRRLRVQGRLQQQRSIRSSWHWATVMARGSTLDALRDSEIERAMVATAGRTGQAVAPPGWQPCKNSPQSLHHEAISRLKPYDEFN